MRSNVALPPPRLPAERTPNPPTTPRPRSSYRVRPRSSYQVPVPPGAYQTAPLPPRDPGHAAGVPRPDPPRTGATRRAYRWGAILAVAGAATFAALMLLSPFSAFTGGTTTGSAPLSELAGIGPDFGGVPTHGWESCSHFISCGSGALEWEITSSGINIHGYGYVTSGSDYSASQAKSEIKSEISKWGSMIQTVSSHYDVNRINIVAETGPETAFGSDGVNDIMQDLSSAWCGGGAGGQSPDSWALSYADAHYSKCSSNWIHFISFAAGTAYLKYQNSRYGANLDPEVLGPAYNAGSLIYTTTYSCSGQSDAWHLAECSGAGLTSSYSWNIAVAFNNALAVTW